jgi:lipid-binding SYLF domain-containing protein
MDSASKRLELMSRGVAVLALYIGCPAALAYADDSLKDAKETIQVFKKGDPGLDRFFASAAGYAVFPSVGKGGLGLGGAYGTGVLFERGKAVGKASLTQVTIGFQLGGQAYSEIIFLQTAQALADFKKSGFALAAEASAVALASGASANAKYEQGVAIFTAVKGGLMYEASVGGQKFNFEPFGERRK